MHRTTQIFQVSTLYGAATLAAALDAGLFGPDGAARRILLVSHNAAVPETALRLDEMRGYGPLAARFDEVVSWNEAISPYHPSAWGPRGSDTVLWQRALRLLWDIGEDERVDLAVESIQANPARALVAIFSEASVDVYADGLMSYGPTREKLPLTLGRRVRRLLHLDLVPGLRPLLLSEYGVEPVVVPDGAFRAVLDEVAREAADDPLLAPVREERPTAVLLGQYLAAINILSAHEEEDLHVRMLTGAVRAGHRSLVFKPHPTAPAGLLGGAAQGGGRRGRAAHRAGRAAARGDAVRACPPRAGRRLLLHGDGDRVRLLRGARGAGGDGAGAGPAAALSEQQPDPAGAGRPPGAGPGAGRDPGRAGRGARVAGAAGADDGLLHAAAHVSGAAGAGRGVAARPPRRQPGPVLPALRLAELGLPGSSPATRARVRAARAKRKVGRAVRRGGKR